MSLTSEGSALRSCAPVVANDENGLRRVEGEPREVRLPHHLLHAQRRIGVRRQIEHVHLPAQPTGSPLPIELCKCNMAGIPQ